MNMLKGRLPGDEKERGQQEKNSQVEGKNMQRGGAEEGGSGKSKAVCQELNLIQYSWGRHSLEATREGAGELREGTNKKQRLPRGLRILILRRIVQKKNSSIQLENIRKQRLPELLNYK